MLTLFLAGCLVDEDDVAPIKNRSTDNFRLIQDGDFYNYRVFVTFTPSGSPSNSVEGNLNVTYSSTTLPNPFLAGGNVPGTIFREYSVLTLGGTVYTVKRYIRQDTTTGALSVLAIRDGSFDNDVGTLFRIGQNSNLTAPIAVEILPSPVPSTDASDQFSFVYQYMAGCESGASCAAIEQQINNISIEYQGNADITTFEGRFNALRVDYNGNFLGGDSPPVPILFNLKGACDLDSASFTQSEFIFPEVGVVFIDNTCTPSGGGGFYYTASLSNTNVPIP